MLLRNQKVAMVTARQEGKVHEGYVKNMQWYCQPLPIRYRLLGDFNLIHFGAVQQYNSTVPLRQHTSFLGRGSAQKSFSQASETLVHIPVGALPKAFTSVKTLELEGSIRFLVTTVLLRTTGCSNWINLVFPECQRCSAPPPP